MTIFTEGDGGWLLVIILMIVILGWIVWKRSRR